MHMPLNSTVKIVNLKDPPPQSPFFSRNCTIPSVFNDKAYLQQTLKTHCFTAELLRVVIPVLTRFYWLYQKQHSLKTLTTLLRLPILLNLWQVMAERFQKPPPYLRQACENCDYRIL